MTITGQGALAGWLGTRLRRVADTANRVALVGTRTPSVTAAPVPLASGATVFVEAVEQLDDTVLVAGWCTDPTLTVSLDAGAGGAPSECWTQDRADVRETYATGTGFVLAAQGCLANGVELVCDAAPGTRWRLSAKPPSQDTRRLVGGVLSTLLRRAGAQALMRHDALMRALPVVTVSGNTGVGFVEGVLFAEGPGCGIVYGWARPGTDDLLWLEIDGRCVALSEAFRVQRQDVEEAFAPLGGALPPPGFILRLDGVRADARVRLMMAVDGGKAIITETGVTTVLPRNPADAVRMLFSIETPVDSLSKRLRHVDLPLIEGVQKAWANKADRGGVVWQKTFGVPMSEPEVSIIVPVYGRFTFFQNQIVGLCEDPEVRRRCEIVYVLDDPRLTEAFLHQAAYLARLWGVAFRVVGDGRNNGFSGANNLGVSVARGGVLLFMNSDVLPCAPGWLGALVAQLHRDGDVGIVAPQLLYGDGGVQHAGMAFDYNDTLDIWTNQHPGKGLLPELLGDTEPRAVDAVTGACLMIDRAVFEAVEGWDTTFVIGDFEDSDLCLKVGLQGLKSVYVPGVQLTHLERQSYRLTGRDDLNLRISILNAVLHEQRWAERMPARGAP